MGLPQAQCPSTCSLSNPYSILVSRTTPFKLHLSATSFRQTDILTPGKVLKAASVVVPTAVVSRTAVGHDDTQSLRVKTFPADALMAGKEYL